MKYSSCDTIANLYYIKGYITAVRNARAEKCFSFPHYDKNLIHLIDILKNKLNDNIETEILECMDNMERYYNSSEYWAGESHNEFDGEMDLFNWNTD